MPLPRPAPFSTSTVCPRPVNAAAPPGTRPTRYSRVLISFGQPMIIEVSVVHACEKGRRKIAGQRRKSSRAMLKLLFADERGQVYEHPELLALTGAGDPALPLELPSPLPAHATLAALPGRRPLGFDPARGQIVELTDFRMGRKLLRPSAVAAVLPPGWTRSELPAFRKSAIAPILPQWAYTAAAWDDEASAHVAWALHTDKRTHWDPAAHSTPDLPQRVERRLQRDDNHLFRQLPNAALRDPGCTAHDTFSPRAEGATPPPSGSYARWRCCHSAP